jgi:hypothetical protein
MKSIHKTPSSVLNLAGKLLILILMLWTTGCGNNANKKIIGKWKTDVDNVEPIEFLDDGIYRRGGDTESYVWDMAKDGRYRILNLHKTPARNYIADGPTQSFIVEFAEKKLVMTEIGPTPKRLVFEKVN